MPDVLVPGRKLMDDGYLPDPKRRWMECMSRIAAMSPEEWFEVIYGDALKPLMDELELLTKEYPGEAWEWLAEWWRMEPGYRMSLGR